MKFKGMVRPEMIILSSFIRPHFVNIFLIYFYCKRIYYEKRCGTNNTGHWTKINFCVPQKKVTQVMTE